MTANARQRQLALSLLTLLFIAAPAAAFQVGRSVSTPEQRLADAAPPTPAPITAAVEPGPLVDSVVAAGFVELSGVVGLQVATQGQPIVTALPHAVGATIRSGDVLFEVAGRPLFIVAGRFPFYRDLSTGDSGPDVSQLQAALAGSGHDVDQTGVFDAATGEAVEKHYEEAGYHPLRATSGEARRVEVEQQLAGLLEQLKDAEVSLASVRSGLPTEAELAEVVRIRELELDQADLSRDRQIRDAELAVTDAEEALAVAEAGGAEAEIKAAQRLLEDAKGNLSLTIASVDLAVLYAHAALSDSRAATVDPNGEESRARAFVAGLGDDIDKLAIELDGLTDPGPVVPATEIAVMPETVVTLSKLSLEVGHSLSEVVLAETFELSPSAPVIRLLLPQADAGRVVEGQIVAIESATGDERNGTVGSVLSEGELVYAVVNDAATTLAELGDTVRARITVASSEESTVVVPALAIQQAPDGELFVNRLEPSGRVEAAIVMAAGGLVAIRSEGLAAGDLVVVG